MKQSTFAAFAAGLCTFGTLVGAHLDARSEPAPVAAYRTAQSPSAPSGQDRPDRAAPAVAPERAADLRAARDKAEKAVKEVDDPKPLRKRTVIKTDPSMSLSGHRALGYKMMLDAGFSPEQWPHLDFLWTKESNWRTNADNPTSTAYGIPQALTGTHKVPREYLNGDAKAQIAWGLAYIKGRYGTPKRAADHSRRTNWY